MADVKRLQIRRDTAANWASVNPMLLEGEIGLILGGKSLKIGDGVNSWSQLPTLSLLEDADREKLSEIILFYEGTDTDDTINKWKELEAFLAGQTETSTLAELLSVKADRTELEQVVSDMGQMDARLSGLIGTKQDAISDLGTIRSNAANGNTAYGWGDHSKAGYAMASSLTATQEEVRVQGLTIDELRESIAGKAGQSSVEQIVASIEELDEFVGNLTTDDVDEGSRKYFTEDLARAAVSEMLTALDTRISQNESNIIDHENKITANTTNLNTTIQRVAANEASIERIDGYCDVFNADIGDLKVTVKGHSTSIEALQTSSAEHSSLLQSLQNGLTTTNATVAKHSEDITALAEAVEELSESWITSTDDLDEGSTNLYFTNARAKEALASELANKLDKKLSSGMKVVATDASGNIVAHYVTTTQLGYLANVTSDLQAQIDAISAPDLSGYLTSDSTLSSAKLDKNSITIAETPVSLGGSISTNTLASKLGLSNFLTGITSSMVTTALGYTPYNSANFTKANIKSTLGISDWALAASKPTYTAAEVGALSLSGGIINGTLYVDGAGASIEIKEGAIKSNLSGTDSWSIDDSGNGVFNSLKVGSSNVALASDLSGYLPLSGGTITGKLSLGAEFQQVKPDRAELSLISVGDNPTDFIMGYNKTYKWSITARSATSTYSNSLGFYDYTNGTYRMLVNTDGSVNIPHGPLTIGNYTAIHTGNISSHAVTPSALEGTLSDYPLSNGTRASGTWDINTKGYSRSLASYYGTIASNNMNDRPTTANNIWTDKTLRYYLATSSMTEGKPIADGHILHFAWDNYGYNSQLYIPCAMSTSLQWRSVHPSDGRTWLDWRSILDSNNYSEYALPKSGGQLTGSLEIFSTGNQWNEGIRIHTADNGWCGVVFCERSNSGSTGTSENTWSIHNNEGIFGIYKNGSGTASSCYISNISKNWLIAGGNVGIGTTNPNTKLHVVGGAKIEGALSTYGITATTTAATDAAFTHYVGSTKQWWVSSYNNCANFSTALYVQSGSSPYKVATVNDLGSYLPKTGGTISGSLTFSSTSGSHIIGNGNSEIIFQPSSDSSGANIPLKIAKTGSSTYTMYCDESGVYDLGSSSYRWKILYCQSASQSSDATMKNILGNVGLTTSQIANAPAVEFTWKNGGAKDVGTIAQYWKEVLPEVVNGEEGSYGMNYAVLGVVSSIILARNIETHEQRIARLEKENEELKAVIESLQQSA